MSYHADDYLNEQETEACYLCGKNDPDLSIDTNGKVLSLCHTCADELYDVLKNIYEGYENEQSI